MDTPISRGFRAVFAAALGPALAASSPSGAQEAREFYPAATWTRFSGGDMNVSSFVFHDWNRNGIYDLGDRPMANVAVIMSSAQQPPSQRRTNISGFANFAMSVLLRDRDIVEPGSYGFRVVPPPRWQVTSANESQRADVRLLPGAPGDMAASPVPEPVGLAPELIITGRTPASAEGGEVLATGPDGQPVPIETDARGGFEIPAAPGIWIVRFAGQAGASAIERRLLVDAAPVALSRSADPGGDASRGERVGFDDLIVVDAVQKIPSGYGAVSWRNWVVTHNRFYAGEGYINGTVSGEYVGYNGSGHPAVIERAQPFDFLGGYFSVAWSAAEGESLLVSAWRGDALVHEDEVKLSSTGPVYFAANYLGVTRIEFGTEHFWQFVADDLSLRAE